VVEDQTGVNYANFGRSSTAPSRYLHPTATDASSGEVANSSIRGGVENPSLSVGELRGLFSSESESSSETWKREPEGTEGANGPRYKKNAIGHREIKWGFRNQMKGMIVGGVKKRGERWGALGYSNPDRNAVLLQLHEEAHGVEGTRTLGAGNSHA